MSQPNPDERIQVDTSDDDSLFDTNSLLSSNLSFASSVRDYCYENGRRYHAYRPGQYPIPNDEEEQDRLALMHHLFRLLTGGDLHRAPITGPANTITPQRVLDVGTGTGEWAIEMAETYPNTEIIGTDLSPIQPNWAPPNVRFFIDDAESEWAFGPTEKFDYVHARSMCGGIADWPRFLKQGFASLKPGGWFEVQEFDCCVRSDDGTHEQAESFKYWMSLLVQGSLKHGRSVSVAKSFGPWMVEAGFENVTDDIYKCPVGGWAKNRRLKEIGRVGRVTVLEGLEPYSLALFTRYMGFTYQEAQELMEKVRAEILNPAYHLYIHFHYVYGQRPLENDHGTDTP
ncbi:uncharacterized protein N7511_002448 [Penicillium nucicola]|uniref:uncharacterized protein n=1 Tax=Penicillium nucicola TaxID=1850975 RepID=UPI00254517D1|nr:uncharacterized protein N7511_002448 [Penicillium nucicola]KAJ5770397.1 hypothetical protein N7511_002448 [Penicillium nucicola]